jgi:hypothetical protein
MNARAQIIALALFAALSGPAANAADSKSAALEALLKKRRASPSGGDAPAASSETKPEATVPAPAAPGPKPDAEPAASERDRAPNRTGDKRTEPDTRKPTSSSGAPKPLTFDDFDLIVKRNIFDPNRRKRVPRSTAPAPPPPPARNSIVLKGTMKTPEAEFASFDSSLSRHRGRFEKNQTLGEFKLTSITRTNATLTLSTNSFTLAVGESLSRTGEGPWSSAGKSSFSSGGGYASRGASSGSGASDPDSGSSSSGGRSAALQRLLEARRKARGN